MRSTEQYAVAEHIWWMTSKERENHRLGTERSMKQDHNRVSAIPLRVSSTLLTVAL